MTTKLNKTIRLKEISVIVFSLIISILPIETILLSWLFVVLTLLWIYHKGYKNITELWKKRNPVLLLPLMYLIYLTGLLYSDNMEYGLRKTETRLGLFLFPFVITAFRELDCRTNYLRYVRLYVFSLLIISIYSFTKSSILFLYELYCRQYRIILDEYPYTSYFFATYLSNFMHYGYFAMYVNVGVIFLYENVLRRNRFLSLKYSIILILWFSLFVMLLFSKAGTIANFLIHFFYFIMLARTKRYRSVLKRSGIGLALLVVVLVFVLPQTRQRVEGMVFALQGKNMDSTSVESTQLRYFAWKASSELVRESVWLGYGTGDVEDVLIQKYKEKNYIGLLKKNLNAHNQFLQTGLSVGIPGVLVLVIYFVVSFVWAFRHRNTAFFIYLIITFMAFLFESYLETRAGVFYLAFFSSFFLSLNGGGNLAGLGNDDT
jgi:hypothetical protein